MANRRAKFAGAAKSGYSTAAAAGGTVVTTTAAKATSGTDEGVIVMCAVLVFGLGFLNTYVVKRSESRLRLFVGTGLAFIVLSVVAEFNSKLARNFAVLILITAMLSEGGGVLNFVLGRASEDSFNPTKSTGTPTPKAMTTSLLGPLASSAGAPVPVAYLDTAANPTVAAANTSNGTTSAGAVAKSKPINLGLGTLYAPAGVTINKG